MIRKYNPERVYNPKDFKNEVRRASKAQIDYGFKYVPLTSRAVRLIMIVPGMKPMIKLLTKLGMNLIEKYEDTEALPREVVNETKVLQ